MTQEEGKTALGSTWPALTGRESTGGSEGNLEGADVNFPGEKA